MNETSPLQKQDLSHIDYKLNEIAELLKKILAALEEYNDRVPERVRGTY